METYTETPRTGPVRVLCVLTVGGAVAAGLWLWQRISADLVSPHPAEFVGLSLLAGTILYVFWLLLVLSTVQYRLESGHLVLRQGLSRAVIPLDTSAHLHRWRWRWAWSGSAERDLGVEDIALFPPFWVGSNAGTYVLSWKDAKGRPRAAALRPSPELLARLKAKLRQFEGLAQ